MSRPIGTPQKKRNSLTYLEIKNVIVDHDLLTNNEILEKYNISLYQLRDIRREYKLKNKSISHLISKKNKIKMHHSDAICGIYGIYRHDGKKIYIGSSVNIRTRLKGHISDLENKNHTNKEMQEDYFDHSWSCYLIKECDESDLLKIENEIICSLHNSVIYNKNKYTNLEVDYLAAYEKMKDMILIDPVSGCWNWTGRIHKNYGRFDFDGKMLMPHRVSYICHNNKYSYCVHHKCGNKICCNPEHLEDSSISQNNHHFRNTEQYIEGNSLVHLMNSKLWPYRDRIIELRESGIFFKDIKDDIQTSVEKNTIRHFYLRYKDYLGKNDEAGNMGGV